MISPKLIRATRKTICGNLHRPGLALDDRRQTDWSTVEPSTDLMRIVAALERQNLRGMRILHVGVGNSTVARRFAPKAELIDGITLDPAEKATAGAVEIPNYRVFILNKFSKDWPTMRGPYDLIIDNNLGSYTCCQYHYFLMLHNYLERLRPRGRLVTDQRGMNWVYDGNPAWRISYEELVDLGRIFSMEACKLTDTVYALER